MQGFIFRAVWGAALLTFTPTLAQAQVDPAPEAATTGEFARFVSRPTTRDVSLDYAFLEDALSNLVIRMGVSTREGAPSVSPDVGSRFVYGHDSRLRMEGNRVVFNYLTDEVKAALTQYRADLERIGTENDIATFPRNEQLAYWINLHNVAIIERIAAHYPLDRPSELLIDGLPLDDARFINVAGVQMSPKDIRTRIVYPNWDNPKVIYGFFRGDIGGPSIQRSAYTGKMVGSILSDAGVEFVNSLRGVEKRGDKLVVSKIYAEAAPFYFPDFESDLRQHLSAYAEPEVAAILAETSTIDTGDYELAIADLSKGENEPAWANSATAGIPRHIARLMIEREQKYDKLRKQGRVGRVIVLPGQSLSDVEPETEVK